MSTTSLAYSVKNSKPQFSPDTGLVGVQLGEYKAYIAGKHVTTLYSDNYSAALSDFSRFCDEYRSIPVYSNGKLAATIDWYTCQSCGKSNDVGSDCAHCGTSWSGEVAR